jgi:hypothetical protein
MQLYRKLVLRIGVSLSTRVWLRPGTCIALLPTHQGSAEGDGKGMGDGGRLAHCLRFTFGVY